MDSNKISILIDGATGKLGSLVTKHALLRDNLLVNILVRDLDKDKHLVEQVQKAGGKVIKADLGDPQSLKGVTKGIHTVISTVSNYDEKVFVKGQLELLDDAVKNGVKRFVHSYFGINHGDFPENDQVFFARNKETVKKQVHKASIAAIDIYNGIFLETIFDIQSKGGLRYAGDVNQKIDLTSYEDSAKYTVAVVSRPDLAGAFNFATQNISVKELAEAYNKVRGTNLQPRNLGTIEEFKKFKNEEKSKDEANWMPVLEYVIYSGIGKVSKHNNAEFPEVVPETLEEFIKRNPDLKLN